MTQTLELQKTLAQLVTDRPVSAKVLHTHGLDYCCKGNTSLGDACARKGLDPEGVLREIAAAERLEPADPARWQHESAAAIVEHILGRYHAPLRAEIDRMVAMAEKVERVHGEKESCPRGLAAHLRQVRQAVEEHLAKEEEILFPPIVAGRGARAQLPVTVMLEEHEAHGEALRRTRALTDDLVPPPEACATWRELYRSLDEFERELMDHIHLENYVLFPRLEA